MQRIIYTPKLKIGDYFDLCLHLTNLAGLYDKYSIHLFTDDGHVTIFTCNHLELIGKLTHLDYSLYSFVIVYGQTKGTDKPNEFTELFQILSRYCNSEIPEYLIKLTYL